MAATGFLLFFAFLSQNPYERINEKTVPHCHSVHGRPGLPEILFYPVRYLFREEENFHDKGPSRPGYEWL